MKKKDLIEQLVSEIETGRIRTLGIYGHGASGKSTFAQELHQALDSTTVNLLDRLYPNAACECAPEQEATYSTDLVDHRQPRG